MVAIYNRKANFEYNIHESFIAGIVLLGTEVKSIRNGSISIQDAYLVVENNEVFAVNLNIPEYRFSRHDECFNPKRKKKLLLNRNEINKLSGHLNRRGYTAIISKCYTNDKGIIKIEVAIVSGKKEYDKREYIKEKDQRRESRLKFSAN